MPYSKVTDLPEQFQGLPKEAKQDALKILNNTIEEYGDEDTAFKAAWAALKKKWKKVGDKWVKKEGMELIYHGNDFVKLESKTDESCLFKKDLIKAGKFIHPQYKKKKLEITKEHLKTLIKSFEEYTKNGGKIPIPLRHTDEPDRNTGWLQKLELSGETLHGVIAITEPDIAEKIKRETIRDVSISVLESFMDEYGNKYDAFLEHVALTTIPHIRSQGPFVELESGFMSLEDGEIYKGEDNEVSLRDIENKISQLLRSRELPVRDEWVHDVYLDFVIIRSGEKYFKVPYTVKDNEIELGEREEVEPQWVTKLEEKFSTKPWSEVDVTKLSEDQYLWHPDSDDRTTWEFPYRDENGINIDQVQTLCEQLEAEEFDIPDQELSKIRVQVEGWRTELESGAMTQTENNKGEEEVKDKEKDKKTPEQLEQENKDLAIQLEDAKKKLKETKEALDGKDGKSVELEDKVNAAQSTIAKLETFKAEKEREDAERKVANWVDNEGKLTPAVKGKAITLLLEGKSHTTKIQLEEGKEEEVDLAALFEDIVNEMPVKVDFEERTRTESRVPGKPKVDAKKKARQIKDNKYDDKGDE